MGIDTGGTYTDAVLLDDERGIIGAAKALTTRYDLSVGIHNAVAAALPKPLPDIRLVSLSTTLATNAIVESKGSPICLLLIGYDPDVAALARLDKIVDKQSVFLIQGGHTVSGEEQAPLDMDAARRAISAQAPQVAAFAISGFFGVRNPAHEMQVKQMVRRLTGLPVTCGHELTTQLDAPRRALTVALNARLIPLLQQLILEVKEMLAAHGIDAPVMVVRGDGSLMDATMAMERPVETILSGPAASVVGACYLCDQKAAFVIDMGGTTTDIAALDNGHPSLNLEGARVGGKRTMVEAVDVHTVGLGGDSQVHLMGGFGGLRVGPRRVLPLCLLAQQYPAVMEVLRDQLEADKVRVDPEAGRFLLCEQPHRVERSGLTQIQKKIVGLLSGGPISISRLRDSIQHYGIYQQWLDGLMERDLVIASALTPTDALHVLGRYRCGSMEAAEVAAALWARRMNIGMKAFCQRVVRRVVAQAGQAVIASALAKEGSPEMREQDEVGRMLIERALGAEGGGSFSVAVKMHHPLIGIGAPAAAYLPALARQLHTEIHIPEHAEVANAIGAVAGGIVQTVTVLIRPISGEEAFRVHLPFGVRDMYDLEEAIAYAKGNARRLARQHALRAGASSIKVHTGHRVLTARAVASGAVFIEATVTATAVGRPRLRE